MLDDAHGIGVMGANGRGTAEYYNCLGQIDIITGTFSKSFGCVGGFAAASKKIIQYLKFYADSNVFSAAPTPQVTASILKALEIIKKEPHRAPVRYQMRNQSPPTGIRLTRYKKDIYTLS